MILFIVVLNVNLLSTAYVAFEMFSEENELIQNSVSPVTMIVSSGTDCIVVGDFLLQQRFVQSYIARVEEIICTTIDGNGQSRLNLVNLAQCCCSSDPYSLSSHPDDP